MPPLPISYQIQRDSYGILMSHCHHQKVPLEVFLFINCRVADQTAVYIFHLFRVDINMTCTLTDIVTNRIKRIQH